jgi:hypothetical protein
MRATEKAMRCMQIYTSSGLRQFTVMPFGVTNGPSYFQEFVLDHYRPLLGAGLAKEEGTLEFFFDDGCLGTGDAKDKDAWEKDGSTENDVNASDGFSQHLAALEKVLLRARTINLRFKLSKCWFVQYSVVCLGCVAGVGEVSPDPSKTRAIHEWPRPSRREDVEKFLCTMGYYRHHLTPKFSELAAPLRDILAELHQKRAAGKGKKQGRRKVPPAPGLTLDKSTWPDWWTDGGEHAFQTLKRANVEAVNLAVPDLVGSHNGTNPFHLFPDACNYGVGAGLFQPSLGISAKGATHYSTLMVPPWATKAEIERKYQDLKRDLTKRTENSAAFVDVQKAYEILSSVDGRKDYDETIGLTKSLQSRVDLQPISFQCSVRAFLLHNEIGQHGNASS